MAKSEFKKIRKLIKPYCVTNGRKFRLKDVDPGDTGGLKSEVKGQAKEFLARSVELLRDEQARLYAQDRWCTPSRPRRARSSTTISCGAA